MYVWNNSNEMPSGLLIELCVLCVTEYHPDYFMFSRREDVTEYHQTSYLTGVEVHYYHVKS